MNEAITDNIEKHARIAADYNKRHPEIYNPIEQHRLRQSLTYVRSLINTDSALALDYGCGTGNVTAHLLDLGFNVEAADVTPNFVNMVTDAFGSTGRVTGRILNGMDLRECDDNVFDLVTVYSVLHHIPDYMSAIWDLVRVLKPNGVLFIDHEFAPEYWSPSSQLMELRSITKVQVPLSDYARRLLSPAWYRKRIKKTINPRYQEEGDIHVWPDDHIDWDLILSTVGNRMRVVRISDYLYYQAHYPMAIFDQYKRKCGDLRELILQKTAY